MCNIHIHILSTHSVLLDILTVINTLVAQHHCLLPQWYEGHYQLRWRIIWTLHHQRSSAKQGCVLAPTLFGIFFSLLPNFAFKDSEEGVHLQTRSDGKLFNYPAWRPRQRSAQCSSGRWGNNQLMVNTKLKVYQACVLSSLLYGSETWSTYIRQENRLESFHLCCLLGILSITWQCHQHWSAGESRLPLDVSNALWALTAMAWACTSYGGPPKDLLCGKLGMGHHPKGRPMLHFKDVCKRDMKLTDIDPNSWELVATNCWHWRHVVREGVKRGEEKRNLQLKDKRQWRKQKQ